MSAVTERSEHLVTPRGSFALAPRHDHPKAPRAWDAADELLLAALSGGAPAHVAEDLTDLLGDDDLAGHPPVIAEERHGALTAAWRPPPSKVVVDSWSSERAARTNLVANGGSPDETGWTTPLAPPTQPVPLLVVRPGRDNARLALLLEQLAPLLDPDALVVGTSMVQHLHTSTLEVFESAIGPTRTTRAHRRARLIVARPASGARATAAKDPQPSTFTVDGLSVVGWPGVFGSGRLDAGTALLLATLAEPIGARHAVDLGCGTGVLAAALARHDPDVKVLAVDDSATAVDAARRTAAANGFGSQVRAVQGDAFSLREGSVPDGSVDLVLSNPPSHDDRAESDEIAWRFMVESRRALRRGGELRVVAHRQLGHHTRVRRVFGNCEVVASDRRFVVLSARRP